MYQEGIDKGKWNLSEIYTIEDKEYVGKDKVLFQFHLRWTDKISI